MNKQVILTQDGLDELKKELNERKKIREKIANEIAQARDQGDLSENAAYTAALEKKQFNEERIIELRKMIANAKVKKGKKGDEIVGLGEKVHLVRIEDDQEYDYILVGESEADPMHNKISIASPIGKAINGKSEGETITVTLPNGKEKYKIVKVG